MSSTDVEAPPAPRKVRPSAWADLSAIAQTHWLLILGALAIAVPTMVSVAKLSWSTEQGAHGPIMLATGIWLISQQMSDLKPIIRQGRTALALIALLLVLVIYIVARITNTL